MKNRKLSSACVVSHAVFFMLAATDLSAGGFGTWTANIGDDLEFGITAQVTGVPENDPWIFEVGYNGAYWFDKDNGIGQTFSVPSDRQLQSIAVRVNTAGGAFGEFEVALYAFDAASQTATARLAFTTGNAADYAYNLTTVPVSEFDLSAFGVMLVAGQTYMLTIRGMENSGGSFFVQCGSNLYGGGSVHQAAYIQGGPDLAGSGMLTKRGHHARGQLLVKNIGTEPVANNYTVAIYLSADGVTPGTFLQERAVLARQWREHIRLFLRFPVPADAYVIAIIDDGEAVDETNENNNIVVLQTPTSR